MAEIVITVDHVYLPLDDAGNAVADWAVTSVATTKVSKRTRLKVPADLALVPVRARPGGDPVMSKRLLDWDQNAGVAHWWLEDGEGNWAQQSFQHTDALIDLNKEAQNHCSPYNGRARRAHGGAHPADHHRQVAQ